MGLAKCIAKLYNWIGSWLFSLRECHVLDTLLIVFSSCKFDSLRFLRCLGQVKIGGAATDPGAIS